MIRKFQNPDLDALMDIWLDANISAHSFVSEKYWRNNFALVKSMLPAAELYVYEENGGILGFVGLADGYIDGIFVRGEARSKGVGKRLLDHVKGFNDELSLNVYRKNNRAVNFYLREDFKISSEGVDEDTGHADYLMLWKRQDSSI